MPLVVVRRANPQDAADLAAIGYLAWEAGILPLLTEVPGMRRAQEQRLKRAVADNIAHIILAEDDGLVLGWCARAPKRTYIPFLFVMPEEQNRGIGSLLLARMEIMLELEGAERVHLETPADNVRAVRFYERQGYCILAMRPDGRSAQDSFTSVRLEKTLQPYLGLIEDEE
jgi:[ribosomal protein S18]-alanine N-acetyltransferase